MALPLAALSCVLPLSAQGLDLTARGGALGQNVRIDVRNGQAGSLLVLVFSLQRATVPFSQFDPSDSRSLGIGLDSWLLGVLDPAGSFSVNPSLPGDPRYAGLSLGLQAATLPGVAHLVDGLSDVAAVPVGIGGAFGDDDERAAGVRDGNPPGRRRGVDRRRREWHPAVPARHQHHRDLGSHDAHAARGTQHARRTLIAYADAVAGRALPAGRRR
jgi:hypothetical protein